MVELYTINWKHSLKSIDNDDEEKVYTFDELGLKIEAILSDNGTVLRFLNVRHVGYRDDR